MIHRVLSDHKLGIGYGYNSMVTEEYEALLEEIHQMKLTVDSIVGFDVELLNERIDSLVVRMDEISNFPEYEALVSELSLLRVDLEEVNTRVTSLSSQLNNEVVIEVAAVNAELTTVNTTISTIQMSVAQINDRLDNLLTMTPDDIRRYQHLVINNDWLEAIQTCLDEHKKAYVPLSLSPYEVSDTIYVKTGYTLYGDGVGSSEIRITRSNVPIIRVVGAHYHISDLYLRFHVQQNEAVSGGVGIELGDSAVASAGAHEGSVKRVVIERAYRGIAIPTWGGQPFAFMNVFENIRVLDSWDYAFHFGGRLNIGLTTNTFKNCYALFQATGTNPESKGFYIAMHDDFTMINCAVDHAMKDALTLEYNRGGTVIDFHAEMCKVAQNFRSVVTINESRVYFTNLQVLYSIISSGLTETYLVSANLNSHVTIENFYERDTTILGGGTHFALVNDPTSTIKVNNKAHTLPLHFNGRYDIEMRIMQHYEKPTVGKWERRDLVMNNFPAPNRPLGWVCIEGGDFATATKPIFAPFGSVSSHPEQLHVEYQEVKAQRLELTDGFTKPTNYNGSSNAGFRVGSANADAVDELETYAYLVTTTGNSTGQKLLIKGIERGNASNPDYVSFSKHEHDFFKKKVKNLVWDAAVTRPTNPVIGQCFFDANLGKPIWFNGTQWVDASGTLI